MERCEPCGFVHEDVDLWSALKSGELVFVSCGEPWISGLNEEWAGDSLDSRCAIEQVWALKSSEWWSQHSAWVSRGYMCDISCQVFLNAVNNGSWHTVHWSSGILLVNELSLEHDWVRTKPSIVLSNNEHGIVGFELNEIRFSYNNFINWDILLVLDSLGFIADGIHTLDNQRPVLPFDYAGRGLADDAYV